MYLLDVASGDSKVIDTDPQAQLSPVSWSHDSSWFAYTRTAASRKSAIFLHDVAAGDPRIR